MIRGHLPTQMALGEGYDSLLPLLHALEEVTRPHDIGTVAEDLTESLIEGDEEERAQGGEGTGLQRRLQGLRAASREEKKRLALQVRSVGCEG